MSNNDQISYFLLYNLKFKTFKMEKLQNSNLWSAGYLRLSAWWSSGYRDAKVKHNHKKKSKYFVWSFGVFLALVWTLDPTLDIIMAKGMGKNSLGSDDWAAACK